MPVFHTKTIESILEPVAQQVSRLVILHEEAEDGNAMPDLSHAVQAVSRAVTNLVKVGRDTINSSDDVILKQDMPSALYRVEDASKLLEEASAMLRMDPYSGPARKKLIEGSRGILQGTSSLLLCFDESEVRKIVRECKKVLDYFAVAEVIETMEDLVQFLKDLSPCLSKVSREVDAREKELTHQVHREILNRCLDQVKSLAPILICSMKVFIHIITQGGRGAEEAAENRNYLTARITEELHEIIRVLQLTTYDEDEWDADNLTVMKKAYNAIQSKIRTARDWLEDPLSLRGGIGEKTVRQILEHALDVAERALPNDRDAIRKMCSEITTMTDALCELRQNGQGTSPQAEGLARNIEAKLSDLSKAVSKAVTNTEKSGSQQPAHTVSGRLEQAQRWLSHPDRDDRGLGQRAISLIVEEGKKVAEGLPGMQRAEILQLCDEVDRLSHQLGDLCRKGQGNSPKAQEIAKLLSQKLHELKEKIQDAVVNRVVEDFADIVSPLKAFTEAVLIPQVLSELEVTGDWLKAAYGIEELDNIEDKLNNSVDNLELYEDKQNTVSSLLLGNRQIKKNVRLSDDNTDVAGAPGREANFEAKANSLSDWSKRAARTGRMVAAGGSGGNKKLAEALINAANQVESLTPQLVNAGRIRMDYPDNKAADEHFGNLHTQYSDTVGKMRNLCDEATDSAHFVKISEDQMRKHTVLCEDAIHKNNAKKMVDHTAVIARLASRVLQVAKQEADNSEDPRFIADVNRAADGLQDAVTPMVQDAKSVALDIRDTEAASRWRDSNKKLLNAIGSIRQALTVTPDINGLHINDIDDLFNLKPKSIKPVVSFVRKDVESRIPAPPQPYKSDVYAGKGAPSSRSPLYSGAQSPRPPPETDDEDDMFMHAPLPNQPIMAAAHGLHQEVRQWSSKDNDIIAAAKKMALLMGRLSQLVRGEMGTKRDLITCAKAIAEASEEVTRLAKELARECTDKRMRTSLLQVCERIPTIGTQLKILSTVKATMLGAQGTEEDQEATDMLVGNAQNLMQSVKETVRAAEAASIKIRTDAGIRLRWVRRQPWYHY